MENVDKWPLVSVLFITYKRVHLLKTAVESFRQHTSYPNIEVVIADDGSGPEIQAIIRTLPADVFALLPKNHGLGANNNNGLRHCSGKYILMLQDDWPCYGPPDYLRESVRVMEANPRLGLVNFAGAKHPVDAMQPLTGATEPCFVTPVPLDDGTKRYFLYSDQPHLISRTAFEHVGFYKEDRDMEQCERDYELRWQGQSSYLTAAFPGYFMSVFRNVESAPSFRLNMLRYRIQRPLLPVARFLKMHSTPLYKLGKVFVLGSIKALEKLKGSP